ncbi:MAG: HlyD family type I secretion periplasmic adaptor subunit [Desulfamplus sp.]|nr:HlyD family type I secretion periplasmic adaptor subunit [Desulfamplus sp.]MBF0411250.1 HlyD family type I secretion periplasmic adaptor subunit [Desulfamplus sp.]
MTTATPLAKIPLAKSSVALNNAVALKNDMTGTYQPKPSRIIIAGLFVILIFFGGLGGVAAYLPFSGAVIAPGIVKVSQEKKTVQHLEGGIVSKILVKEGDKVNKGDVLIKLKSSQVTSSVALLKGRLASKMIEAERLEAQRDFKKSFTPPINLPDDVDDLDKKILAETKLFEKTKLSLESRISSLDTRARQIQEKIQGTQNELRSNQEIIRSFDEEIRAKAPLAAERYMDKAQLLTLKRQLAQQKGEQGRLEQVIAESKESIEEIKFSILSLENDYRQQAATELSRVKDEIFQISMQLSPQLDADERLSIRAPATGVVINLAIHSEDGGVIRPGEPLLDIVPENADLIIESQLRQDMITKVYLNQETKVQLAAFNRITTPPMMGIVSYISADSVEHRLPTGQVTTAYIIHVKVPKNELEKNEVWLSPGMPATCFIETEQRTFLQYLMEPIMLNFDQSLRETL